MGFPPPSRYWFPMASQAWEDMSPWHLCSAEHLARCARQVEDTAEVGAHTVEYEQHRAYVVGSVLCAALSIEATANEHFAATKDEWMLSSTFRFLEPTAR